MNYAAGVNKYCVFFRFIHIPEQNNLNNNRVTLQSVSFLRRRRGAEKLSISNIKTKRISGGYREQQTKNPH